MAAHLANSFNAAVLAVVHALSSPFIKSISKATTGITALRCISISVCFRYIWYIQRLRLVYSDIRNPLRGVRIRLWIKRWVFLHLH